METFQSAILRREEREQDTHGRWFEWYQKILSVRRRELVPRLMNMTGGGSAYLIRGPQAVSVQWRYAGGRLQLDANLSAAAQGGFDVRAGRQIWLEGSRDEGGVLGPWTVEWYILDP